MTNESSRCRGNSFVAVRDEDVAWEKLSGVRGYTHSVRWCITSPPDPHPNSSGKICSEKSYSHTGWMPFTIEGFHLCLKSVGQVGQVDNFSLISRKLKNRNVWLVVSDQKPKSNSWAKFGHPKARQTDPFLYVGLTPFRDTKSLYRNKLYIFIW